MTETLESADTRAARKRARRAAAEEAARNQRRIALVGVVLCTAIALILSELFESPLVWWWVDGPHAFGFEVSDALGVLYLVIADVLLYLRLYWGKVGLSRAVSLGMLSGSATLGAYQLGALALLGPIVLVLLLPGVLFGAFISVSEGDDGVAVLETAADIVTCALVGIEVFFILFAARSPLAIAVAYPSAQGASDGLEANLDRVATAFEGDGIRGMSWQERADWIALIELIESKQLDIGVDELPPVDIALTTGRVLGSFDGERIRISAQILLQDDMTTLYLIEVICHEEFHVLQRLIEKNGIDAYDAHTHLEIDDDVVASWLAQPHGVGSAVERDAYEFGYRARFGWAKKLEELGVEVDWTGTFVYTEEDDLHFEQYL